MRRIIISLVMIGGIGGALAIGTTGAFFNDRETSTGNTFAAGAVDLKIGNESYYNGAVSDITSWLQTDLTGGLLFFNFKDLKPDDEGEDTISIHVNDNDAYVCMDMTLTSNDDVSSTEPELLVPDDPEDENNTWDGELAQNIQMFWWADDGDNVYEDDENSISGGVKTLYDLATSSPFSVALADAENNVWNPNIPGPIPGGETVHIAKAWCFGDLRAKPLPNDDNTGPLNRGTGFSCNGEQLDNLTQTDAATMDVAFRAVQARHNNNFLCGEGKTRTASITVIKQIVNDNGGNNSVPDFQLFADNGTTIVGVTSGVTTNVVPGNYTITETGVQGYAASFNGDCDVNGQFTLNEGDNKTCTITNNDLSASITLIKNVINDTFDGDFDAGPTQFGLRVNGFLVQNNTSTSTNSNTPHTINEDGRAGYTFVGQITGTSNYGKSCPESLGGTITLDEGEAITCTITNDDI